MKHEPKKLHWPAQYGKFWLNQWSEFEAGLSVCLTHGRQRRAQENLSENSHYLCSFMWWCLCTLVLNTHTHTHTQWMWCSAYTNTHSSIPESFLFLCLLLYWGETFNRLSSVMCVLYCCSLCVWCFKWRLTFLRFSLHTLIWNALVKLSERTHTHTHTHTEEQRSWSHWLSLLHVYLHSSH